MLAIGTLRRARCAEQHLAGRGVLDEPRRARRRCGVAAAAASGRRAASDRGEDDGAKRSRASAYPGRTDRAGRCASAASGRCSRVELRAAASTVVSCRRDRVERVAAPRSRTCCEPARAAGVGPRSARSRGAARRVAAAGASRRLAVESQPARISSTAIVAASRKAPARQPSDRQCAPRAAARGTRYQPETAQTSRRSRAASAPAAVRQSPPESRKA